jgi:DNA-damage-inducible protein D
MSSNNNKYMDSKKTLIVFEDKNIRRIWYNNQWFFSIVDVVEVLTQSPTPRQYWGKVKDREFKKLELSPIWVQLKLKSNDNKLRLTDCANTKDIFRIIQSISSKKAEPFKQWLAQVGYERIEEIENPEIAQNRVKEYYELKGYPKDWIDKRLRGISVRQELTDEWTDRGVNQNTEFAILTNEISKATFGKTVSEYKKYKKLQKPNQNLRDHMTDWELILTMVGEKATTDITKTNDSKGFNECKVSAIDGGTIAKNTRKAIEKKTGKPIVSNKNYLKLNSVKKLKNKKTKKVIKEVDK